MKTLRKFLFGLLIAMFCGLLATAIWESHAFDRIRGDNPVDATLSWLSETVSIWRIAALTLVVWSVVSLAFLAIGFRRIIIHRATYFTPDIRKDVTESVRKLVEQQNRRAFQVENDVFGPDPQRLVPKQLTVEYTVHGKRKEQTVDEHDVIKFV